MTKRIFSGLVFIIIILVGCTAQNTDGEIPTQIVLPTSTTTDAPTQTPAPSEIPPATPTELVIPRTDAQNPTEQAFLRMINASPDIGVVDVYIESLAMATNLEFKRFTEREGIVAGRYKLRILPTGSFITDPALYEEELIIVGEQSSILVITGTIEAVNLTILNEPNAPLPDDTSRLLMINAMAGIDDMVMLVDGTPQTATTPYLQISETTEHPSGLVDISFQTAGSPLFETQLDLRERQNYTFILLGTVDRSDTQAFLVLNSDAPGLTDISFVNASPSIGLIDIYFGNQLFVGGADYAEISIPESILSGTYDISIYPEGANPDEIDPLSGTQFIANPDEEVVLVLVGEPSSLRFVIYRNDPQPTFDNRARITFINSLESVSTVILNSTEESLNTRLSYGRISDTYEVESEQPFSLTWIQPLDDVQDVALEDFSDFSPVAGHNYLYIFAGRGFDDPILLSLEVGTLGFDEEEPVLEITNVPASRPTRIRLVNMWENRQFLVRMDGTMIAEGVEFGKATNLLIVPSGEHNIIFYDFETDTEVIEISQEFEAAKDYSLVVYNMNDADGDILSIDDTDAIITSATGGIRLTVLDAKPESNFGIGYSEPNPNISQPDASENYRRSLPLGIQQIIREVPSGEFSEAQRIPTGTYNIRIIDNNRVAYSYTHIEYTIEPATLYNVFLRENQRTGQTNTLIVPYPTS